MSKQPKGVSSAYNSLVIYMRNDTFLEKNDDDDLNDDDEKLKKGQTKQNKTQKDAIKTKKSTEPITWFIKSTRQ